eukprot:scaffold4880_cov173-Skeletonema_dohrnii-CCMP3373.AAC.7
MPMQQRWIHKSCHLEVEDIDEVQYRYKCSTDRCTSNAVQGGVCVRHGAKTSDAALKDVQEHRLQGRNLYAAWSKEETMQLRGMHKSI